MRHLVTPLPASAAVAGPLVAGLLVAGLLVAGVVAGLFARRRFVVVRVSGTSMVPAYRPGDRVLVRRGGRTALRRGQVVVFRHGSRDGTGPGTPEGTTPGTPDSTDPGTIPGTPGGTDPGTIPGTPDSTDPGTPGGSGSPFPGGTNAGPHGGRSPYGGAATEVARLGGTSWLIKRIAAVPGDRVPDQVMAGVRAAPGDLVPAGRLVVLGDGPASMDSRRWGYLRTDEVLGVVIRSLSR
ncbi:S26 family signal peptidase [Microbispora sp. H10949]|uniref:S26 family signal peptidase n=1 Tax=Microbispora sp. H10949 TaxID=2729111 RepID=UPI001C7275A6|nr:S26 family signal peptidase [Microbispora sp. H10949]